MSVFRVLLVFPLLSSAEDTDPVRRPPQLFKACESKIKGIGAAPVEGVQRSKEESEMRTNAQRSLATQLTELSQEFRNEQRVFLQKVKYRQDRRKAFSPFEDEEAVSPEKAERLRQLEQMIYNPGFSEEQIARMILQEELVTERNREVIAIAQSISDLAEIFHDLSQLVIEQGSVLDRIDYNLEQTEHYTEEAHSELQKASEYQRRARMKLCIILLIVVCSVLGLVFFLR